MHMVCWWWQIIMQKPSFRMMRRCMFLESSWSSFRMRQKYLSPKGCVVCIQNHNPNSKCKYLSHQSPPSHICPNKSFLLSLWAGMCLKAVLHTREEIKVWSEYRQNLPNIFHANMPLTSVREIWPSLHLGQPFNGRKRMLDSGYCRVITTNKVKLKLKQLDLFWGFICIEILFFLLQWTHVYY